MSQFRFRAPLPRGFIGILEVFFTHYPIVLPGWITSMRLLVAGSLVLRFYLLFSCVAACWTSGVIEKLYLFSYAILGIFSVQFSSISGWYSNATTATICNLSVVLFVLQSDIYQKKASIAAILYVLIAMLGVFDGHKGDLSQLSHNTLGSGDWSALSAVGSCLMFILPQHFARHYVCPHCWLGDDSGESL